MDSRDLSSIDAAQQRHAAVSCMPKTLYIHMNHARLFEEILLDLQPHLNSDDAYELIKSSKVLRQLLLDGDALLHLVNRKLRAKPTFSVRALGDVERLGFSPEIYPGTDREAAVDLRCSRARLPAGHAPDALCTPLS